jgi:hypothetical protein
MVTRTAFPPHELTESEAAAVVGRFVMSPIPQPDPAGRGEGAPLPEGVYSTPPSGRDPAAPHGVVYVRADLFDDLY